MSAPLERASARYAARPPGAVLLHPVTLAACAVLVLNDHVLKRVCPGVVSGKLSDLAGMVLGPLVASAALELGLAAVRGAAPSAPARDRLLVSAIVATGLTFALTKLTGFGNDSYRVGLGMLQWPFRALVALASGATLPEVSPVTCTPDPTDLVALPFGFVAYLVGRSERRRTPARALAALAFLICFLPRTAAAASFSRYTPEQRRATEELHDGLYLDVDSGAGGFFVWSQASISNGFVQHIATNARATAFPTLSGALGATLPHTSFVLGLRLSRVETSEPIFTAVDQTFVISEMRLAFTDISFFGRYYFDPHGGLHVGGALGFIGLGTNQGGDAFSDSSLPEGRDQMGVSFTPEVGQAFWIRNEISIGIVGRVFIAHTFGQNGNSTLLAPTALVSLVWN